MDEEGAYVCGEMGERAIACKSMGRCALALTHEENKCVAIEFVPQVSCTKRGRAQAGGRVPRFHPGIEERLGKGKGRQAQPWNGKTAPHHHTFDSTF